MTTWMEPSWKWDPGCEIWGVNYQNETIYNGLPFWCGFPCRGATWDFIGWLTLLHAALSAGCLVGPYWTISRTTKWETAAVPQWWWPTISLANDISLVCTWRNQLHHSRLKSYPHLTPPRLNHRTKTWVPQCCGKRFWDHLWSWDQLFWTAPLLDTVLCMILVSYSLIMS